MSISLRILCKFLAVCAAAMVHAIGSANPGRLDTTFGSAGRAVTAVGSGQDSAYASALQPDGKLVLGGFCFGSLDEDFCLVRYNSDGSLDTSFGASGKVITPVVTNLGALSAADYGFSLLLQPDGKIVLGGYCPTTRERIGCVIRYLPNGAVDAAFGTAGKVFTSIGVGSTLTQSLARQTDGKLLLAGLCSNGTLVNDFCAARINSDGSVDSTFGSSGLVVVAMNATSFATPGLAIQTDGKAILVGTCDVGGVVTAFCALRLNADGSVDLSYGVSGKFVDTVVPVATPQNAAEAVKLQVDGKLVIAGACRSGSERMCALRLNSNGTRDASFGGAGYYVASVGTESRANDLVIDTAGRVLLAGSCRISTIDEYCAVRVTPSGQTDLAFGVGGVANLAFGTRDATALTIQLQTDGRFILAGECDVSPGDTNIDFCAARFEGGTASPVAAGSQPIPTLPRLALLAMIALLLAAARRFQRFGGLKSR